MMDDMSENAKSEQYQEKTGRESNPIGVAAVSNPSILAERFMKMEPMAWCTW